MATPKRNCLWCAFCSQYDEGCYHCSELNIQFGHAKASAARRCARYAASWCRADDNGEVADGHVRERERALYERRMRGDWS